MRLTAFSLPRLLMALLMVCALAAPAGAKMPQLAEVPRNLPDPPRGQLMHQRGELALQWSSLVERVKVHNSRCYGVVAGSELGRRCRANMADIRRRLGEHIAAVERFNLAVAAAELKHDEARGEGVYSLLVPTDREIELGRQVAAKIAGQCDLVRDPEVSAYVQRLGWKLSRNSGRENLPYKFEVIERIRPGAGEGVKKACGLACAGPGGVIFLNRAAMKYIRNESELAGVLAHEIGHVAARHQVKELVKVAKAEGVGLAAANLGSSPAVRELVQAYVADLAYFKFTRDQELEADRRAVEMLFRAGIPPTGLSAFLGRYARGKQKKEVWDKLYASHPGPAERIKALAPLMADSRFKSIKHQDSAQFKQVRAQLSKP